MRSIVLCEKPSQARNILKAVGRSYGDVVSARGHLLRLTFPHEEKPEWKKWSTDLLRPPSGRYALRPDDGAGKSECLQTIKTALSQVDTVFIATDCDREGQAIAEHILRYLRFQGSVRRVIFTAEDERTLAGAFAAALDNAEYRHLYDAAIARQQADQVFNLSLTRATTVSLVPGGVRAVIGVGRVKTPTMAIVCRREQELRDFAVRSYFEVVVDATVATRGEAGEAGVVRLAHRPLAEARIFDEALAQDMARVLGSGWKGPAAVKRERKQAQPPRPMDLPALQQHASAWGWTAKKTLDVAQALYEVHKVITYPRSAVRFLPEGMAQAALAAYAALVGSRLLDHAGWKVPCVRSGASGTFWDEGLDGEPHHAIIPNPAVASEFADKMALLSADERRLFDAIARTFAICLGPDHVYDRTEIVIEPPVGGRQVKFRTSGRTIINAGWKAFGPGSEDAGRDGAPEDKDDDGQDNDGQDNLPPIEHGDLVQIGKVTVDKKATVPPARYTEGSLIGAMRDAWRFDENSGEQARLKQCKGIGTPATRDGVIEGLKDQALLTLVKGKLHASDKAMQLYDLFRANCPELVDVGLTARMEARLDAVVRDEVSADTVIDEVCQVAERLIAQLCHMEKPKMDTVRTPSPRMVEAARWKAKRAGIDLPPAVAESYDECRAFLGPLPERREPSQAQLMFAEKIAARVGSDIPDADRQDAVKLSRWIDSHNLASEKQLIWITKLVDSGQIQAPRGYPDRVSASDARTVLDAAFSAKSGGAKQASNAGVETARRNAEANAGGAPGSTVAPKGVAAAIPALATDSQLKWIRKLVERDHVEAPAGFPDGVSADDAKKFLDEAFGNASKDDPPSPRRAQRGRGARAHAERAHRRRPAGG